MMASSIVCLVRSKASRKSIITAPWVASWMLSGLGVEAEAGSLLQVPPGRSLSVWLLHRAAHSRSSAAWRGPGLSAVPAERAGVCR